MFSLFGEKCRVPYTAKPNMDLLSVKNFMDRHYLSQVPVVSDNIESQVVGLLDTECITVTWRYIGLTLNFFFSAYKYTHKCMGKVGSRAWEERGRALFPLRFAATYHVVFYV